MSWATQVPDQRFDWRSVRDHVDIGAVAAALLGSPHKVQGPRLFWLCPFHNERTPSFMIGTDRATWRCWGCGMHGDAADLVERIEGLPFPESARRAASLVGADPPAGAVAPPKILPMTPKERPSAVSGAEAGRIVADASERLWEGEGGRGLAYLLENRGLTEETIRNARLGWCPGVKLKNAAGTFYSASGVVIPWFDGDRLALVKIRRIDDGKPKYVEVYRDLPRAFPTLAKIRPGHPLVVVEGEFDALLLDQEIGDHAAVITIGSASNSLTPDLLRTLLPATPWFVASDNDEAGDRFADSWPARARRVKPYTGIKDWTDQHSTGYNRLRHHWMGVLRIHPSWADLEGERWADEINEVNEVSEVLGCVRDAE